jgi:RHS repeat-associated protein
LIDTDTQLVRFGYRDYDPYAGRWTAKDPIFFKGGQGNLFGYTNNNPVNWRDSSGLIRVGIVAGGGIEAGDFNGGAYQASSGAGIFTNGAGAFTSSGGFADNPSGSQFVFGATAGLGTGAFITNANSASQLLGPFDTWNINIPLLSIQVASDGSTVIGSVTFGKSLGLSLSRYTTTTTTATGGQCRQ